MTVIQTVQIFAKDAPPAPYVLRAPDGGWHFDCGNTVGWSCEFPEACACGHCLPSYEAVRQRVQLAFHESNE